MSEVGAQILDCLARVERQRQRRAVEAALGDTTQRLKAFQQERFRRAYGDLLATPRYTHAARFFLEELYGPADFSRRDAQFQRIVRPLVRLFPCEVVDTVHALAQLHALSEELDSAMAERLLGSGVQAPDYIAAWQAVGQPEARQRQIELTLAVGRALDVYTRKPLLRHSLRLMRGPAQLAGLHELQDFLECGFDTFRAMRGAQEFLGTVQGREQDWAQRLFAGDPEGALPQLMA
ncbi:hypothetical protein [Inhella sp.]|uniref:FFLEELY motif protein n=1 Tax=Inhella sp. TaxID=1921806 RepID=UPI0035B2917C